MGMVGLLLVFDVSVLMIMVEWLDKCEVQWFVNFVVEMVVFGRLVDGVGVMGNMFIFMLVV